MGLGLRLGLGSGLGLGLGLGEGFREGTCLSDAPKRGSWNAAADIPPPPWVEPWVAWLLAWLGKLRLLALRASNGAPPGWG